MSSKPNLETLRDHVDLSGEDEPYTLPNTNVGVAKDHDKNWIKKSDLSWSAIFSVIVFSVISATFCPFMSLSLPSVDGSDPSKFQPTVKSSILWFTLDLQFQSQT